MFSTLNLTWSSENEISVWLWGCCEISWRVERTSWSGNVWQRLVEVCDTDLWKCDTDLWWCDTALWEVETDDWLKVLQLTQLESTALFLWYKYRYSPRKSGISIHCNVSNAFYVFLWMDQVLSKKGEDRVVTHTIIGWPKGWPRQGLGGPGRGWDGLAIWPRQGLRTRQVSWLLCQRITRQQASTG